MLLLLQLEKTDAYQSGYKMGKYIGHHPIVSSIIFIAFLVFLIFLVVKVYKKINS